ncbi:MAG: peptide ABC transporter substrate-binding protein [Candidatus Pacebacteria bacterium]|nr:peptide ABC transporter substrate-binding protein [Candidatus Paceibacterota bacterium]MBP9842772.1 peptide ABC transporter substrate-binding protein [Candidatus Paceibacterota bacterium]
MNPNRRPKFRLFDRLLALIEASKPSDRLLLRVLFFATLFSGIFLLYTVSKEYSEPTPISGGTFTEGIVGTPRFINPALATTRVDQDLTALLFSGLMKIDETGTLIPNIAESITVSEDGLTYNVIVRKDIRFHDDKPLTARDVIFTIQMIQNPDLKSPLRGNWAGVTVEEVGEYELNVVLTEPYAPFIENFQFGIVPAHLWSALPSEQIPFSQLNTEPIGSGPFKMESVTRDKSGIIKTYTLTAFRANSDAPNIETFSLKFFSDESALITALEKQEVNASAYVSNENLSKLTDTGNYQLITSPLPRVFGIFFNQNKSAALRDPAVREALSLAINRDEMIADSLHGQGFPIFGPVTVNSDALQSGEGSHTTATTEQAKQILTDAGWLPNNLGLLEKQIDGSAETLSITLRTSNVPLFDGITQSITDDWKALGVEVAVEQFEQAGLVQSVIRPRDFQALLFGLDMSRSGDLYPFWHSSQKSDPGLNIAQYTNLTVDTLLQEARTEQDTATRISKLQEASTIIGNERPATFLFQPMMTYVVNNDVIVSDIEHIGKPSDRFSTVTTWYTDSDTLWKFFQNEN